MAPVASCGAQTKQRAPDEDTADPHAHTVEQAWWIAVNTAFS